MSPLARALPLVAVVLLAAGACGGDADGSSADAPPDADLVVTALDIDFEPEAATVDAGARTIALQNDGGLRHTLVVEGVDGFKLEVGSSGDVDSGTVELEPGSYTVICDVPGHEAAGMTLDLTVR